MNPLRAVLALPRDLIGTAARVRRAAGGVLGAVEEVPALLRRVTALVAEAETVAARLDAVATTAMGVVEAIDVVRADAAQVLAAAEGLRRRAQTLIDAVEPLVAVAGEIEIDLLRAAAARLQPLLGALTSVDVAFPADVADLIGRTRPLIEQMETLVMPLIREARAAIPDVRDILPVVQRLEPVMVDVETRIAGLPGSGRMRKRGEKEIEEAVNQGSDEPTENTADQPADGATGSS